MPRFTVITPFWNQERYLGAAITSVLAQTFADWELLLIDDGSTDLSPRIAAEAAAADRRVRVLHHPGKENRGAAASRNLGLRYATGEFVTFLDGDDYFLEHRLAGHAAILTAHPGLVAVYGLTEWLYEDTGRRDAEHLGLPSGSVQAPPNLIERILLNHEGDVPCVCAITLRTDVVRALDGFAEEFTLYEDQTLWVKVFAHHAVLVTDQCDAVYRQHPQSTSSRAVTEGTYAPDRPHEAGRAFLRWMRAYLKAHGVRSPSLDRSLRLAMASLDPRWPVRKLARLGQLVLRYFRTAIAVMFPRN